MTKKKIKIKEIADICGVSEQAIRGWCRRNQVAKDAKGSFAISESIKKAIFQHYGIDERNQVAKLAKPSCETCETKNNDDKTIELLEKQLEILSEQLNIKDEQIKSLTKALDQQQQLQAMTEQKLMLFEEKSEDSGGRERVVPIVQNVDQIVERFRNTEKDKNVWEYVNSNADIHSYRADYARFIYKKYARDIDKIPYDKINKGTKKAYQSEVYVCRKDEAGKKLDKKAMHRCTKALGHNRIEIVANNYLRGI